MPSAVSPTPSPTFRRASRSPSGSVRRGGISPRWLLRRVLLRWNEARQTRTKWSPRKLLRRDGISVNMMVSAKQNPRWPFGPGNTSSPRWNTSSPSAPLGKGLFAECFTRRNDQKIPDFPCFFVKTLHLNKIFTNIPISSQYHSESSQYHSNSSQCHSQQVHKYIYTQNTSSNVSQSIYTTSSSSQVHS